MGEYKWATPHEWLRHCLDNDVHDPNEMAVRIQGILMKLDGDTLQDAFEDLMDSDGYFNPVRKSRK